MSDYPRAVVREIDGQLVLDPTRSRSIKKAQFAWTRVLAPEV